MPESAEPIPGKRRELTLVLVAWLLLAAVVILFAKQNLSVPGLYYDEAVFAGLAKDFVTGHVHGPHMPDHETIALAGRPFPFFVQTYLGALKCWMLIPAFRIFGSTFAVLRGSNLFWQLIALLLLMLGARRWLGLGTAVIAGALLAFDPTYFFISMLDWGVAVPSFVCRCACFLFAIRWRQMHKLREAFLVGLFAGLGFFNKLDFAVFVGGVGLAALICYWKCVLGAIREYASGAALACVGFVISGGPMLAKVPRMVALTVSTPNPKGAGEFAIKLKTMLSMYDGTYFYRLMSVGGVFERMYDGLSGPRALLGVALIIACICFAALASTKKISQSRPTVFLIVALILITLGVFALPYAIRIHHAALVYPLPHLTVAAVMVTLWRMRVRQRKIDCLLPAIIAIVFVALLASELRGIVRTEQFIQETGGRGRWSDSLDQFCRNVRNRSDLRIISLDWGFNEQLLFLTDGPQISEPFWQFAGTLPPLLPNSNYVYLAHASEFSVFQYDIRYFDQLRTSGSDAEITPYLDRQGAVAFFTIRFRPQ